MKYKKVLILTLTAALTAGSLAACGSSTDSETETESQEGTETAAAVTGGTIVFDEDYSSTTAYASVTAVDGDTITLAVYTELADFDFSTLQEMEDFDPSQMTGGPGQDGTDDAASDDSSDDAFAGLDGDGSTDSDSDSDSQDFGGQMPSGDSDDQGFGGQMPSGDSDDQGFGGQMPSGDSDGQGFGGQMPGGDSDSTDGTSDGDMPTPPSNDSDSTDGNFPSDGTMPGGMEDFDLSSMESITATLTITDESILTDLDGNAVALSDIEEDDILIITLDSDGNVTGVIVTDLDSLMSSFGGGMGGHGGMGDENFDPNATPGQAEDDADSTETTESAEEEDAL